ncbi:MAG: class I SAM-dependent methyltransferase [Cyanobacteria bacterium P01_A01_bin.40]
MKSISEWQPSKIKLHSSKYIVNSQGISPGSLYITLEAFRVLNQHKSYLKGHLIDLGCGMVPYYEWYQDQVEQVTCVDWYSSVHESKHVDIFADLNQSLPLEDGIADSVLSTSVLEHIREPKIFFQEIKRVLTPDGHLLLSVPFQYHLHEEPFDYYRYTAHGLEHLAKEAGLEIVSLQNYGSALGVLVDVSSKIAHSTVASISKLFPGLIGAAIRKSLDGLIRWIQQLCFSIFKLPLILAALKRLNLSSRIPLGYVVVFKPIA